MQRHPYFDLWLHETEELGRITGSAIVERVTLHEWPLSCVQRLACANGQTFIYKVQSKPTVEPEFHRRARSPLLVGVQVLPVDGMPGALLLEDVRAPRLGDLGLSPAAALRAVDDILDGIAHIEGDLPALLDIRTLAQWLAHAQAILANLRALVEAGSFTRVTPAMVERVAGHCHCAGVLAAIEDGPSGYVHGDLFAENVLEPEEGHKVLDWQRPIWGPVGLDRAALLASLGVSPEDHLPPRLLRLRALLSIDWLAQAEAERLAGDRFSSANQEDDFGFVGTPAQVIEQMRVFIDLGVDTFMLECSGFPRLTTLEMLVNEVIPAFSG